MGLEALAAKWRVDPRDLAVDDAPTHEPMRQGTKPMQRRAPSADQKRVRREMARGQQLPKTASETHVDDRGRAHDTCGMCFRPIHDSAGIDPNVPWVHEDSGNALCEVNQPADAVMLRGVEMPQATPIHADDHRTPWHYEGSKQAAYYTEEYLRELGEHSSPAKSWNIADQTDRGDGSGDAGGTPVSQSMSDSSVSSGSSTNSGGVGGSGAGSGSTASRLTPFSAYHSEAMRKGAPFAGYDDFEDCTEENSDKDDPDAYCGEIKHRTEDKKTATRNQVGVANSMGQILLKAGDAIRMPTGQSVNVKNVRRHETSSDHYYVDTDMGTTVVPWSTQFDVVRGGQQEVLPGPGVSGGNFGDMPGLSGNVEQSGQHQQQNVNSPTNQSDCPSCKTKGSLVRRGGKFQCNQCGFTQNPQGGGMNFSDATQQYLSKINDPRSAIARRCAAVLAQPDPNQKESL